MGRTACTEPQCLYSIAIPLLPVYAARAVQSLSACRVPVYKKENWHFQEINHKEKYRNFELEVKRSHESILKWVYLCLVLLFSENSEKKLCKKRENAPNILLQVR